jgi:hypothetical protein
MLRSKLLVLAVLTAAMMGCGEPPPEEGYVRDRRFVPAHWESGYDTVYTPEYECNSQYDHASNSYKQVCGTEMVSRQVYESHHHYVNDAWALRLESCEQKEGKEKCRQGWKQVDETTYHSFPLGSYYPTPK